MDILNAILSGRSVFDIAHQIVVEGNDGRPIVDTENDEPEVTVETDTEASNEATELSVEETEESADAEKTEEPASVEKKDTSTDVSPKPKAEEKKPDVKEEKKEVKAVANSKPKADEKKPEEKEAKTSEPKALPPAGTTNRLYANVFYNFVDKKSVPKMPKETFNRIAKRVYNLFTNQEFVTAYPYMYHKGYNFVAINLGSKIPAFELCSIHTLPNGSKYMKVIVFTEDENGNNILPDSKTWFVVKEDNKIVQENVPYGGMSPYEIYNSVMGVTDKINPALSVTETA